MLFNYDVEVIIIITDLPVCLCGETKQFVPRLHVI